MKHAVLKLKIFTVCFLMTFFLAATTMASSAPLDYNKAFKSYKNGDYAEAKECWLKVWKSSRRQLSKKQKVKLFLGLSNSYIKLEDIEKAKRSFSYAKKLAPNSKAVARLEKKIDNLGPATMTEAIEELRYAQLGERGAPGSSHDNFARLLPFFRRSILKKEELVRAHRGLAICLYYTKGDLDEVESNLLTAIKLQPADSKSTYFLALVEKDRGNFPKELEYLEAARKIGMDTPELYVRLAILKDKLAVEGVVEKVMVIVEYIVPYGLQHVREIYNNITNFELKDKIGKLLAALEEKQKKEEEQKKKEEEEKRLKEMLIVKYFGGDG